MSNESLTKVKPIDKGDLVKLVFSGYNNLVGSRTSLVGIIEYMPQGAGDLLMIREFDTGKAFAVNTSSVMFIGMTHIAESEVEESQSVEDWGDLAL